MITGACLCGALQFEIEALGPDLVHCHCARCRKHHGAPFASFVEAATDALRWVRGEDATVADPSSASRGRRSCATCGAVAPSVADDRVRVPAGNLAGDLGALAGRHVFVRSKAPWHVIADDLPRHDGAPTAPASDAASAAPTVDATSRGVDASADVDDDREIPGSCLCGAVTFTVRGAPARWYQCHCSRCRRARSAAHGSNTFYPTAQLTWDTGRDLVRGYRPPDAERFTTSFCARCGGGAPTQREGMPFALVPAGLLDGDPGRRPDAHIHVASRAAWYPPSDDGLPQFSELPPP